MTSTIKVDTISENTSANGVAIDGVTIKDSVVLTDTISEKTSAAGVTIDGLLIKDSAVGATGTATSVAGIPFYRDASGANGSIYTHDVSGTDNSAANNTAYGITAMDAITTGDYNTAIGNQSASALNTGSLNTFLGYYSGAKVTEGADNVLIGREAGGAITSGSYNTLVGGSAGKAFDTESNNTGFGYEALRSGSLAGAEYNVAIGNYTLDAITSGDKNTVIGYDAGGALTTGSENTIIGENAGSNGAITGDGNTVVGKIAGYALTSGHSNTLIGRHAASALTTGLRNVALGWGANDSGANDENDNMAIGFSAMAAANLAGAEFNVAVGNYTLDALTSGDENTTVGFQAGTAITTGTSNTLIGKNAGYNITTGANNIILGAGDTSTANNNDNYSLMIGYGIDGKGSNTGFIYVGGSGTIFQGNNNSAWATTSDERVKKNIKDYEKGLDEINKLKIKTFNYRRCDEMPLGKNDKPLETTEMSEDPQVGLIAQEVRNIFPNTVKENPRTGILSLQNDEFTWALVKAVQELSATVTTLQQEINTLKGE